MKLFRHYILIFAAILLITSCSKKNDPVPQTPTQPSTPPINPPPGVMAITNITPDYGKAGTEITINGAKFSATIAGNIVKLGGKTATVSAATATQLKINAPADATHGTIQVKVGADSVMSAMFYYEPIVASLSVTSGKAGDVVVITGQHFGTSLADFEVKFNTTLAEITAATATTLSVKVPVGATAGVVSVARKTKQSVNGPTFTVNGASATPTISSITPDYGKSGTEITINGNNFGATPGENIITLGGKVATVTSATATQLKIKAPSDATHGAIQVKVGANVATSGIFNYEPIITSLSATSGKVGDVIVITGQHFGTALADFEVKFSGAIAEITAASATTLTVKVPTGATAGIVSVSRKTKQPVNGPSFTVNATGGSATGFTVTNGSVAITKLVTNDGAYGQILCMTIDDVRNVAYAGTKDDIIKIDLATNTVSSIIKNSTYLKIAYGEPSAIDVDANGKVYVYASTYGVIPTTGSNIYVIDPVSKTATIAGNRFVGYSVIPNSSFGVNTPFVVMGNGDIIAFDKTNKELCKFSADLSTRTVIYTLPLVLEGFVQLIKVNATTVRIVLTGLSDKYSYEYNGALGLKSNFLWPNGFNMVSQTIGGTSKYGVAGLKIEDPNNTLSGQPRTTYTVGRLNASQTAWEKTGSFIIENFQQAGIIKAYDFIGLNGKNYFYADKNGNMYMHVLGSGTATSGIYKIALN